MAYRVIFKWDALAESARGWTENFWLDTVNETLAVTSSEALRVKLNRCKGNQAYVARYTLQDLTTRRAALNVKVSGAGPSNVGGPPDAYEGDNPVSALRIRLSGLKTKYTQQWLRGVPDSVITRGGVYTPAGLTGYQTRINELAAVLKTAPWSIQVLDPGQVPKSILSIDGATGIVTTEAHGYLTGDKVRIMNVRTMPGVNAVWKVSLLTPTTFQLQQWVPTVVPMTPSPKAVAVKQVYIFQPISAVNVVEASSHYTGGPTRRRSGRRRKKKV